jgi:LacI family transcriptional regulator
MTVSRVINGASGVRHATRERVEAAILEVGYSPNVAARHLATAGHIRIAILYAKPHAFIGEFLFGALNEAARLHAQFIVEKCEHASKAVDEIKRIVAEGADGLLIAPPIADNESVLDFLESSDVPAVVVTSAEIRASVSAVRIDAYEASRDMTRHLISLGHRRIGFIAGHPEHSSSRFRLQGYRDALNDGGLEPDDELVAAGRFTYQSGLDAAEQLLALPAPPTAIFAANDDMAAATIATSHRHGLDVPGDLTVCGFDDTPLASEIWPQLTTIHVPVARLTHAATNMLIERIRAGRRGKPTPPRQKIIDYELVRRQSDAPPRRRPPDVVGSS